MQLVAVADRKAVGSFLKMSDLIDLAIPRGGLGLIERVCRDATMPVLKHFSGNCHVYVDAAAERFTTRVDTGVAMVNVSTRFNDGGELGFGAELGISTDKLHARGPCGIKELTTYKYVVTGTGQIRS